MSPVRVQLADVSGLTLAQHLVIDHHYLHRPVDVRCSPLAYLVMVDEEVRGTLIFGRPESTCTRPLFGGLADLAAGRVRYSRWQVLNLARVWLDPAIQQGGVQHVPNAATQAIGQALRRVVVDYLLRYAVVWPQEPYELRLCLSYCDTRLHRGALYRAANFDLARENERGIQTYVRPLRRLTARERRAVLQVSETSERSRRLRSLRAAREAEQQMTLWQEAAS